MAKADTATHQVDRRRLALNIALIAAIWILSDRGFYYLLPALKVVPDYTQDPITTATYYVFWIGVALITFSNDCAEWRSLSRWQVFDNRFQSFAIWVIFFAAATTFTNYVMPALPPIEWRPEWGPVPELARAGPTYFLPKSFEILFQQILILTLVLTLAEEGFKLATISLASSALFGGIHLLLFFDSEALVSVIRYSVAATLFGLVFPVLILRVRNGLAYSYALHWLFYAVTVFMAREIGPTAVWPILKGVVAGG